MATAEVVIVGGGANGASTAFQLTQLGVRNVVLLERRKLAAGATGKSGSLVRMHYTNEAESRLAFESLKIFQSFDAIVGGECGFEPIGFLQLVGHADPDGFHEGVDPADVALCREKLAARLPVFAGATMRGGWAGMIMMSPDGRPIIDRIPSIDGLHVMLGDSGTSFKTAPAIGRCLAEWIVEGKPRLADLTPFRSTRFAEGRPWIDEFTYGRERLTISR